MPDGLLERIYEASFLPELWPEALDRVSAAAPSLGGVIFASGPQRVARWKASDSVRDVFAAFVEDPSAPPPRAGSAANSHGFLRDIDVVPRAELTGDPLHRWLTAKGLGWTAGTTVPMPSGEVVVFSFERRYADGPHSQDALDILDTLRPHLARAALMAARLGMERARTAVATLEALGLPAAILSGSGRLLALNAPMENASEVVLAAHGRLALVHAPADRLLREAIAGGQAMATTARSIPIPGTPTRLRGIAHVLPLVRSAHDIFGGETLVVLSAMAAQGNLPAPELLPGLFDLTPREAQLAVALSAGQSLKEAADGSGLRLSTARSYLEDIFRKTGTNRQSQLVALLKGARPASLG